MYKLILKKFIFNSRGSSLVQVMVISGMVSVFGLAVMQTQKNVKSVQSSLLIRDANNELKTAVTALLKYPEVCAQNFDFFIKGTADVKTGPTDFVPIPATALTDYTGAPVYIKHGGDGSITYFGKSRINNILIGRYFEDNSVATLRLTLDNVNPTGSDLLHLGGRQINLDIPIRIFYDNAGLLKRCMAEEIPIAAAYDAVTVVETQLAQLCQKELGGSFFNGDCQIPEFTERSAKSKLGNNTQSPDNFCQNFGGEYIETGANAGTCTGVLSGSKNVCDVPGEVTKGFTTGGTPICDLP